MCDYTLIITDYSMKPINGYETSIMIRNYLIENDIDQPMIALCTGDNIQMDNQLCNNHGINTVLKKPIDMK